MADKFHSNMLQAWATILNDRDDATVLEGRNYQVCVYVCVCERERERVCVCVCL